MRAHALRDANGVAQVEAMVGSGMPHNLTLLSDEAVVFFGLDGDSDPLDAAAASGAAAAGSGNSGEPAAAG